MKKLRKIIILISFVMLFLTACKGQQVEYEYQDIGATQKEYINSLAEDVIFVVGQYQEGAPIYQCIELLKMDYEEFERYKESEYLSDYDQKTVYGLWANTSVLIEKMQNGDYDTEGTMTYIYKCIERLKEGENTK